MSESKSLTPIQLANKLQNAFLEFDPTASVPPQMIYNYLAKNVRKLRSRSELKRIETSKGWRESYRFTPELAEEFVAEMVASRKERIRKNAIKVKESNSTK